jgi:hypothetical protein
MNKKTQKLTAFIFGVVFVVVLIVLAIAFPNPTPFQYTVFRVILALASAGVAAMIPGFLEIEVPNWIRAGGALAVFIVVYFYNPASLVAPIGDIEQKASGEIAASEKREFLQISPEEILSSLQSSDTPLAADNIARTLYYGKYVQWPIKIQLITAVPENKAEVYWDHGFALFDNSKPLLSLKPGTVITISGRIKVVSYKSLIELDRCQLLRID